MPAINDYTVIIMFLVCGLIIGFKVVAVRREQKELNDTISNKKFEKYDFHKKYTLILLIGLLMAIFTTVYGTISKDEVSILLGFILIALFVTEMIGVKFEGIIYYCNEGVVIDKKYYHYKELDKIRAKGINKFDLITVNKQRIAIRKETAKFIADHYDKIKVEGTKL